MKRLIIAAIGIIYIVACIMITVASSCPFIGIKWSKQLPESTILPSIPEYVDGQPVKYQMPLKQNKKDEVKYPPNYLLIWTAKWCVNCSLMKTLGDKLEKENFDVFYIDFDKNEEKAKESMIGVLPTAIIYTDGEEVKRVVGIKKKTKKIVEAQIREALEKNEKDKKEKSDDYDIY